jgi:hypothetical protein
MDYPNLEVHNMTLAIPGAKFYLSACNRTMSKALLSNTVVDVDTELREEVAYWQFLYKWSQPFPWLNVLSISSDSPHPFKLNGRSLRIPFFEY